MKMEGSKVMPSSSDFSQHHNNPPPPAEENMGNTTLPIEINDNMSRLQNGPGNDGFLSAGFSPKSSGSATERGNCYNNNSTNSKGKVKKFKCKQCDFFSISKLDYWKHIKTHMEPSKVLSCPNCPFVTVVKHHLKYHLDNHAGLKPFKCSKCEYSGVNQSMLNAHMKTHSNIYQYRCANCPFASKYCHSLKLHLRKYSHSPAMVLNLDGTPNPSQIVDVYGTRRRHKINYPKQDPSPNPKPEPNTNDSAEEDDEEDERTYTTIFDIVEVVDGTPNPLHIVDVNGTRRGPKIKNPGQRPNAPNPNVLPLTHFPLNQVLENAANMFNRVYTEFLDGSFSPLMIEIDRLTRKMQADVNLDHLNLNLEP